MNFKNFLYIICYLTSISLFGQFNTVKFENLSTSDGISSSTCTEIFQDKEGFLWFGTIDGLNKYNGYEFEIFRSVLKDSTSISNSRINTIDEDKEGNLWIGTNNGLNVFDKKTNKFKRVNLYRQVSLSNASKKFINDLLYDDIDNAVWVATHNGAIKISLHDANENFDNLKISYYLNDPSNLHSIDNNSVHSIVRDKENKIWVGTNGQNLNCYNRKKDHFDRVFIESKNNYELNHIPKRILVDSDNDFWIGNDLSNFIFWNKKENNFRHISLSDVHVPISNIYQDKQGILWVSTDGHGLFLLKKGEDKVVQRMVYKFSDPFSLPNNKPSKVFEDKDGIFWVGSYDKGVSKLDPSKYSFGHYYYQPDNTKGLSEKIAQSVLQDSKERIWISSYNGGLNLFNEEKNSFQHFGHDPKNPNTLSSTKILYSFEAHDGTIWVCTLDGGLNKFDPTTKEVERFFHDANDTTSIGQNSVWTGVQDDKKRMWFGLRTEGLSLYDPVEKKFTNYKNTVANPNGLGSNFIFHLFIDSKNRLLIGTSLGLNYLNLDTLNEEDIPNNLHFLEVTENGIEGNSINYITEDHLGHIWVGTDSGIYRLDEELKLMKSYSTQNGLPNNIVVGIKEDHNNKFWITTKSGLSSLNPITHQFKNFNEQDGLQGIEFQSKSIEKTKDGRIIVGGINGFNIFHPNDISLKTPVILSPKITNLKLNNKRVFVGDMISNRILLEKPIQEMDNLVLKNNENYIAFEFLALHFENPKQVQYAYKMHGLDEGFINSGTSREVSYSNLSPGNYIFEVKSFVDDQIENAKATKIRLKVLPPLWKTWWAYCIYFALGIVLFWMITRYYTEKVQEAQQRELDQVKLQFFVNVSHEFRTPLTLILNPVDKILSGYNSDPEMVKYSALSIQRSARRLLHLVNQLLDYRKMDVGMAPLQLEKGNLITFCRDIFSLFEGLAEKKEIQYTFNTDSENVNSLFDFDKVEKILTNLISNALKFTNPGGQIEISIHRVSQKRNKSRFMFFEKEEQGNYIEISVRDTGVGLDKQQMKTIFSRFHNLDSTKSGTGIGLNFTKGLVELHGGEISVESEYQKGSTFSVLLPLNLKAKPEEVEIVKNEYLINSMKSLEYNMSITNEEPEIEKQHSNTTKLPVILLVEDNKELRVHLKNDLRNQYVIREAVNGAEGIKMAKKYHPDIIVSDVMMPITDGFEMCKTLKNDEEMCHIPIILLTARTLEDDRIEGYDNGADAYLPKPFMTTVLMSRIKNLLESKNRVRKRFSKIGGIFPSSEVTTNNQDQMFLDKATKIILENISDIDFKQEHLLKEMGVGRSQFYRKISALTGHNPSYFIRTIRLRYASELLQKNLYSIKEVTHLCGFNSTAYFSKTFRELFNVTPTEFIEQKQQEKVLQEN